ncbi:hypothetical protein B0H12DRAFT_1074827 [Mycena haematopus]|nr:hypothetical protein B0H12DRAFT_1074827 [Mycena haematopus]
MSATTFNDNPSGDWTPAHLAILHRHASYLRAADRYNHPGTEQPEQYNSWVYEVKEANEGVRDLPPFTDDYTGKIPRKRVDRREGINASADGSATDFLVEFARGQLDIQRQQADLQNRAAFAMFDQGVRAGKTFKRGGAPRGCGRTIPRRVDTYYGRAYENGPEAGEKRGRADRSESPEERRVRRRSRSPTRTVDNVEPGQVNEGGDVVMGDAHIDEPVAGPSNAGPSNAGQGTAPVADPKGGKGGRFGPRRCRERPRR